MKTLAINKYARSSYEILETLQAGIKLTGAEVKSVKLGNISLRGSYVTFEGGDPYLVQVQITPYAAAAGSPFLFEPQRRRKLLLHRSEVVSLQSKVQSTNLTIIPLKVYTKGGIIKIDLGLARGLKKHDKREVIKKREAERAIRRILKYQ